VPAPAGRAPAGRAPAGRAEWRPRYPGWGQKSQYVLVTSKHTHVHLPASYPSFLSAPFPAECGRRIVQTMSHSHVWKLAEVLLGHGFGFSLGLCTLSRRACAAKTAQSCRKAPVASGAAWLAGLGGASSVAWWGDFCTRTGPTLTSASPAFAGSVSTTDSCQDKIGEALSIPAQGASHSLVELLIADLAGLDLADVASALAADLSHK